jgi:hypothetical protein
MIIILCGKPYLRKADDRLHLVAQVEILLVLTAGYMLLHGIQYDFTYDILMSVVLIGVVCSFLLYFLGALGLAVYKAVRNCRKSPEQRAKEAQQASVLDKKTALLSLMPKPVNIPKRSYPAEFPGRVPNIDAGWDKVARRGSVVTPTPITAVVVTSDVKTSPTPLLIVDDATVEAQADAMITSASVTQPSPLQIDMN